MPANLLLDGVRILDLSQYIPGPFATRQLADLGAEVIKVEPPGGDPMRYFMHSDKNKLSPVYRHLNRGKRVCRLDLKSEPGKQSLTELLTRADILLESFRPGVLQRLGFGREQLDQINPRLIHCALSGYGQSGPYRNRAGHDLNYCAASGALGLSGISERPLMSFPPIADHAGAMQASSLMLAALHARSRSGKGLFLDVSLFESCLSWQYLPMLADNGARAESLLNGGAACYNIYRCSDGFFITLAALEPQFWQRFCNAVNRDDWLPRHYEAMPQYNFIAELGDLFARHPRNYWEGIFASVDCCYEALLMPDEVANHVQAHDRGLFYAGEPGYPGFIDGQPVSVDKDFVEIGPDEALDWTFRETAGNGRGQI